MPAEPSKDRSRLKIIALAGNPNSGKTTIFNQLTGDHQRVGNWSGVTVERRDGWHKHNGNEWRLTDLPGMYSLSAESPDEEIACNFIIHGVEPDGRPDLVVQVIDGGSLQRSLLLTAQLIEQELPVVIALNMYDEMQRRGVLIDPDKLSQMLGVPVIPTVGNRGLGISNLIHTVELSLNNGRAFAPRRISFDDSTERLIRSIHRICLEAGVSATRGRVLGLLMEDRPAWDGIPNSIHPHIRERIAGASPSLGGKWYDAITHARYAETSKLLAEIAGPVPRTESDSLTSRIDAILIHRVWGLPVFLLLMVILFELTFQIGSYPMNWIDQGIGALGTLVRGVLPAGAFADLLVDGIISGAGMILVFLPNIIILLMGIHLLEDSGYMARAAFLMDRVMRMMGLHGRSFIPMLMGFGCNVPALLATRTLESKRDRILTMLLAPLMSCSARLPVYVMVAAAFFPKHGGLVIFGLYALGTLVAVALGRIFGQTLLKGQGAPFIMELPPYRWPTGKTSRFIFKHTIQLYMKRIGTVVFVFAVSIWFLSNYPKPEHNHITASSQSGERTEVHPAPTTLGESTYLYRIGKVIEPVMDPLGFNLPMNIALVSGFVAKEAVVATFGVLFSGDEETAETSLIDHLQKNIPSTGVALAFLVFVLLYTPCLTTVVTLHRESKRWRWTIFSVFYQTSVAWLGAFTTLQISILIGIA